MKTLVYSILGNILTIAASVCITLIIVAEDNKVDLVAPLKSIEVEYAALLERQIALHQMVAMLQGDIEALEVKMEEQKVERLEEIKPVEVIESPAPKEKPKPNPMEGQKDNAIFDLLEGKE